MSVTKAKSTTGVLNTFGLALFLIVGIFYILVIKLADPIKLSVNLSSNNCEGISVITDVLRTGDAEKFGKNIILESDDFSYELDFLRRSKIVAISFCPNSEIKLNNIGFISENKTQYLPLAKSDWYCISCKITEEDGSLIVSSGEKIPRLETVLTKAKLGNQLYLSHAILRYTPYLLTLGFIFLIIMLAEFSLVFNLTLLITGIIVIIVSLYSGGIRATFTPEEISESKVIGASQYNGFSTKFDLILVFILLVIPLLVAIAFKWRKIQK